MPFNIKIKGIDKFFKAAMALRKARQDFRARLYKLMDLWALDTVHRIQDEYMRGPRPKKLGTVTGALRRETRRKTIELNNGVAIKFGNPLPYAAIHEFGGTIKPHTIFPKKKGFLAFKKDGKWIYTKKPIFNPGSVIPARPYLRPGVNDMLPILRRKLDDTLKSVAKEGLLGGK